ncbi:MAG: hypothetical protein U5K79_14060 [Cyclobacteriaceae bacterium]|nr:hypothetical protein [Cyclobacteriaceae bacterium]
MKKLFFILSLFLSSGLITVQKVQAQCPTLDPSVGTSPIFGAGIEVCYQAGGSSADITFTFLNDGSDFSGFLLYDLANSSFLLPGLTPVVYVQTGNVWVVQNVPDQFLGKDASYVFAKLGCGTYGGFGINLDPSNELLITDSNVSITNNTRCIAPFNGAITVGATGGYGTYTYSWTGPNGFTASTATISSLEPGTYSVIVTDGHNCSFSRNIDVADNAINPVVSFNGLNVSGQYCATDAVVILTGSAAPNGTFAGPGITDLGNGTANFDPATAGAGGNIVYTYTDPLGCTGSATLPVVVSPIPATPIATNNGPACEGDNITLSTADVPGAAYDWIGPNGFVSTVREPVISNITAAGAGVYSVTVTLLGCPSLAGTTTVVVNPLPATPTASNDGPVCEGGTIQLSTPAVGGATYAWTGPNGFSSNLQNPTITNITAAGVGSLFCHHQ